MGTTTAPTHLGAEDLHAAEDGSYFTILGAGGAVSDWVDGMTTLLQAQGVGTPAEWFQTTGRAVNLYAGSTVQPEDQFAPDLTILLFPLQGLDLGRLAALRLADPRTTKWFDDVVQNMRRNF